MTDAPTPAPPAPDAGPDTLALARRIAALVREKRGVDVVLLDVRSLVDYTDFFLIASGASARQNQTIAEHVIRTLKADRRLPISRAGIDTGTWICIDLGDVVAHVFEPDLSAKYDLALLWADAPRVEAEAPPPPTKRHRLPRKAAVADADAANAPESERPPDEPSEGDRGPLSEPLPAGAPPALPPAVPRKGRAAKGAALPGGRKPAVRKLAGRGAGGKRPLAKRSAKRKPPRRS